MQKLSKEEFVQAYWRLHSGKTGETIRSNAERLFNWLAENGYLGGESK